MQEPARDRGDRAAHQDADRPRDGIAAVRQDPGKEVALGASAAQNEQDRDAHGADASQGIGQRSAASYPDDGDEEPEGQRRYDGRRETPQRVRRHEEDRGQGGVADRAFSGEEGGQLFAELAESRGHRTGAEDATLAASHVVKGTAATRPMLPTRVRMISTATTSELAMVPSDWEERTKRMSRGSDAPA